MAAPQCCSAQCVPATYFQPTCLWHAGSVQTNWMLVHWPLSLAVGQGCMIKLTRSAEGGLESPSLTSTSDSTEGAEGCGSFAGPVCSSPLFISVSHPGPPACKDSLRHTPRKCLMACVCGASCAVMRAGCGEVGQGLASLANCQHV